MRGIFVTGTGTDVGKTFVSALMVKGLRASGLAAGYYKPILSGALWENGSMVPGDAAYVCRVAALPDAPMDLVSYCFMEPVSPHLAARKAGEAISLTQIMADFQKLAGSCDYLTVEGCGGLFCPLRLDPGVPSLLLTDVILALKLPVVIVATSEVGTINAAVLTAEHARLHALPVYGFIMNGFTAGNEVHEDNRRQIEYLTRLPVLATVPPQGSLSLSGQELAKLYTAIQMR
jgi:dethiobiotin synthetase